MIHSIIENLPSKLLSSHKANTFKKVRKQKTERGKINESAKRAEEVQRAERTQRNERIQRTERIQRPWATDTYPNFRGILAKSLELCQTYAQNQVTNAEQLIKNIHNDVEFSEEYLTVKNKRIQISHKCKFPTCKKTFTSSGWFRAHLVNHLRGMKHDENNIIFYKYIYNDILPPGELD